MKTKSSNRITLKQTGTKIFTVYANGGACWTGDFAMMSFKASGLAKELGWPVLLEK